MRDSHVFKETLAGVIGLAMAAFMVPAHAAFAADSAAPTSSQSQYDLGSGQLTGRRVHAVIKVNNAKVVTTTPTPPPPATAGNTTVTGAHK
jgi:hypothetical protein